MRDVDVCVGVIGAAVAAALGVRRVHEPARARRGHVLDAEVDRVGPLAPEVRDERIIRRQHERRRGRRDHLGPALGDRFELAVAIELVAVEVREHDRAGSERGRDLGEPEFVDLEEPEPRRAAAQQGRGDAARHVGAGDVVHVAIPAAANTCAASAAVVVLPLVAEISTLPSGSRAPRRRIAPRFQRQQDLAGKARPAVAARARQRADAPRERRAQSGVTAPSSPARP